MHFGADFSGTEAPRLPKSGEIATLTKSLITT